MLSYQEGHVAEVEKAISDHVESHHLGLSKDEIEAAFEEHYSLIENGRKLDLLVDDYFGPPLVNIDGEVERGGGMKDLTEKHWSQTEQRWKYTEKTLNNLNNKLENGGLPMKLSKKQYIALAIGFAPMMAASINVIFG